VRRIPKPLKRLGCGVLLVAWFLLLLAPCLLFVLAVQRQIEITYSDVPQDSLRIWSIQERDLRGIAVSNSRRVSAPNDVTCTIIDVRFLLWEGQADSSHQCSCYTRANNNWMSIAEGADACKIAGE
jgi:hypothetical protein